MDGAEKCYVRKRDCAARHDYVLQRMHLNSTICGAIFNKLNDRPNLLRISCAFKGMAASRKSEASLAMGDSGSDIRCRNAAARKGGRRFASSPG
jgi:hypothetical protein